MTMDARVATTPLPERDAGNRAAFKFNSLAPGMELTPFNQPAVDDPDLLAKQVQSIPFKRAA